MKLTPVNGVNIRKLVFVLEINIFITCFNFWTIYQVGGLQTLLSASNNGEVVCCINFIEFVIKSYSLFLRYLHSVPYKLHKN